MKTNKTSREQELSNHRRRKEKESNSSIDLGAHNQRLKQQKQLNGRNDHIPMNINTEFQCTQLHHQKHTICKLD
jgi:hypothetical protein